MGPDQTQVALPPLDPAPVRPPHQLVQLQLEAHRQAVPDDLLRQPGGVQAAPHGAEQHVQPAQHVPGLAPGLGPGVVVRVAEHELQLVLAGDHVVQVGLQPAPLLAAAGGLAVHDLHHAGGTTPRSWLPAVSSATSQPRAAGPASRAGASGVGQGLAAGELHEGRVGARAGRAEQGPDLVQDAPPAPSCSPSW